MNDNYKFYEFLNARINENDKRIQELFKDENVRKFVNLLDENNRLTKGLIQGMEECSHVFVKTKVTEDGEIYHCLKCGLTNEYAVTKAKMKQTDLEKEITDIFKRTFGYGIIISDKICKLSVAREVYDFIKRENQSISHTELQETFARAYPKFVELKERGTLGKCKIKKSAAEQWYEMEQRCEDNAIATLNRIVENNEGKRK